MMGNEAMYMLAEGVASAEDIDTRHAHGVYHPMGPLDWATLQDGTPGVTVLKYLHRGAWREFRPCPLMREGGSRRSVRPKGTGGASMSMRTAFVFPGSGVIRP
jgi:3-hydroxybutyryl-CoA dehydrogenase